MKPSQSNAASQARINGDLKKRYGTPHNVSNGTGCRSTQAAGRAKVNSAITGMKWGESPNDYGKGV